jgi:hypothetical protein
MMALQVLHLTTISLLPIAVGELGHLPFED